LRIYFNKLLTDEYVGMLKGMEEFVWHYLDDVNRRNRLVLQLHI
jgi:hypothetical protein